MIASQKEAIAALNQKLSETKNQLAISRKQNESTRSKLADANKRNEQLVAESKKMQEAHALATADLNTKLAEARKGRDKAEAFYNEIQKKLNSTEQQVQAMTERLLETTTLLSETEKQREESERKYSELLAATAVQQQSSSSDAEQEAEDDQEQEDAPTSVE